ncbi:MAG: L,D-transpeptidase [Candidatus Margulisiibacteriota bacterium]
MPLFIKAPMIAIIALFCFLAFSGNIKIIDNEKEYITLLFLQQRVLDFAQKYSGRDVIVVSKKDHLLFYCRDGKIVKNDYWNGFNVSFPVKVSLASRYFFTPEGEMFIDAKNANSRYTLFLKLSVPSAYGIHGASTRLASHLDKMETINPNYSFVTKKDDTRGCVAVENRVIKYLFAKVDVNTPVLIMP